MIRQSAQYCGVAIDVGSTVRKFSLMLKYRPYIMQSLVHPAPGSYRLSGHYQCNCARSY